MHRRNPAAVSHEIMIIPEIDYREEIIHWWWMDEALGTEISDSSGSSGVAHYQVMQPGRLIPSPGLL